MPFGQARPPARLSYSGGAERRSSRDSIRVSEAPDPGSIPVEATTAFPMFFAYVLKSIHHHYSYKGHCKDLQIRLDQHNAGLTFSNKHYRPSRLFILNSLKLKLKP